MEQLENILRRLTTTDERIELLINNGYRHYKDAVWRGYIRKGEGYVEQYAGRYGNGFRVHQDSRESRVGNRHHLVTYYIKER